MNNSQQEMIFRIAFNLFGDSSKNITFDTLREIKKLTNDKKILAFVDDQLMNEKHLKSYPEIQARSYIFAMLEDWDRHQFLTHAKLHKFVVLTNRVLDQQYAPKGSADINTRISEFLKGVRTESAKKPADHITVLIEHNDRRITNVIQVIRSPFQFAAAINKTGGALWAMDHYAYSDELIAPYVTIATAQYGESKIEFSDYKRV